MSSCLQGSERGERFTSLDVAHSDGTKPGGAKEGGGGGGGGGCTVGKCSVIFLAVLISLVAIIGFILGCYATSRVRDLDYPEAQLVSNPRNVPSGYSAYALGTGLGYWSAAYPMLHPRSDHGVIASGKYAYLIGGLSTDPFNASSDPFVLSSIVRYDSETSATVELAQIPQPRSRFAYALLNGRIYVIGGVSATPPNDVPLKTLLIYDIASDTWSFGPQLKTARADACGAAINGMVYVTGGYDETYSSLASTEEYDPSAATAADPGAWVALPASGNLVTSRGDCRAVAVAGRIIAAGGAEYYENPTANCSENWVWCYRFLSSVESFDPYSKTWTQKSPMISARGDFGIEALPGGRVIVAGGERGNGTQNQLAMYEVEEYVVDDDIWVQKAPLPQARFRADLAYISGRVYTFGGAPSCAVSGGNDTAPDACFRVALDSVFAYFDVQYPRLYAFVRTASVNSNRAAARRLML